MSAAFAAEQLQLSFTTTSPGNGGYDPDHIHAVWITKNDGTFVKTIGRWAGERKSHLTDWAAADGTDIDGATGATQGSYKSYGPITWNLRDRDVNLVPQGEIYKVNREWTNDAQSHRTIFSFVSDYADDLQNISSQGGYKNVTVNYTAPTPMPAWFDTPQGAAITSDGHFFAAAYNFVLADWAGTLDTNLTGTLNYNIQLNGWLGLYLYDYTSGLYSEGMYVYAE